MGLENLSLPGFKPWTVQSELGRGRGGGGEGAEEVRTKERKQ